MIANGLNLKSFIAATPYLTILATFAWMVPLPLQLVILPQVLMMGISGHVRISLMRPNCMKLVPMIVNGWKCIRQIVALLHPRIRAAFSQIVPLPAIIMSQDM
jgi:hypothetical protein